MRRGWAAFVCIAVSGATACGLVLGLDEPSFESGDQGEAGRGEGGPGPDGNVDPDARSNDGASNDGALDGGADAADGADALPLRCDASAPNECNGARTACFVDGFCRACRVESDLCSTSSECCPNLGCLSGHCVIPGTTTCRIDGEPCNGGNGGCCTGDRCNNMDQCIWCNIAGMPCFASGNPDFRCCSQSCNLATGRCN